MDDELRVEIATIKAELREVKDDIKEIKTMMYRMNNIQRTQEVKIAELRTSKKYIWLLLTVTISALIGIFGTLFGR